METRQFKYATEIAERYYRNGKITKQDWWLIEGGYHDIFGGNIREGKNFIDSLEPDIASLAYKILETVGFDIAKEKSWTCKVAKNTTGIPWIWRGREAIILDCEEIDEEAEMYTYHLEMEYNGRIYRTWINSEDVEI